MGIETVAVYSDEDAITMHVRLADYSYNIGPADASESYLNIDALMEAAERTKQIPFIRIWIFIRRC